MTDERAAWIRLLATTAASVALFAAGLVVRALVAGWAGTPGDYLLFAASHLLAGYSVLLAAARNLLRGKVFDENLLMTIATAGAFAIGELPEAAAVMLFFRVGELLQGRAMRRSRRSVRALLDLRPDHANLLIGDRVERVEPEQVEVGAHIIVRPGERIPLDGTVTAGESLVDTAALTGESVPRRIASGDSALAGMINQSGRLTVAVERPASESSIARILTLVEQAAARKARTEQFISRFARIYTPLVVAVAAGIAVVPPLLVPEAQLTDWVYRALVVLVVSCPCALVISVPLGYLGGIGAAARRGILLKGSAFIDALTRLRTVVFDKTGTLTKGSFTVTEVAPQDGRSPASLVALAARAEVHSTHPIARSVLDEHGAAVESVDAQVEEVAGRGMIVRDQTLIVAGNDELLHDQDIAHDPEACDVPGTVVHVARDGRYAGYLVIADEDREDAAAAVQQLRRMGVERIVMLTGDQHDTAAAVAERLGIEEYHAELLPEAKLELMERILDETARSSGKRGGGVAFVGDGINDAPALARADVGIAMGALGSDAAIETADVVLMSDAPSKVAEAVQIARRTRRIIYQNITLALAVKALFVVLGLLGVASIWEAVIGDVGVALLAIVNATRLIRGAGGRADDTPAVPVGAAAA